MGIIDFKTVFDSLIDEYYCIVKFKPFDDIKAGDDVDIFTFDIDGTAKKIIDSFASIKNFYDSYKVRVSKEVANKCYVDVLKKSKIYFRFDLYGSLPNYTRAKVKPGLFECCIETAKVIDASVAEGIFKVKVAGNDEERILRYLEYIEWYERRPDKIKHLDYVLNSLSSEEDKKMFLDRLHYYTGFPEVKYEIRKGKTGVIENFKFLIQKCRGKSVGELWSIFKQKFL